METTRTLLTKITKENFDLFFKLYGNVEVMKMITGKALSEVEARRKFETIINSGKEDEKMGFYAVFLKETGEGIGMAKIVFTNTGEAEIGYVFLPEFWGKGFGYEVSESLVNYAISLQTIKSLIAIIDPENVASAKILIKSGFEPETTCVIDDLPAEVYRLIFTDDMPPRREDAKKFQL